MDYIPKLDFTPPFKFLSLMKISIWKCKVWVLILGLHRTVFRLGKSGNYLIIFPKFLEKFRLIKKIFGIIHFLQNFFVKRLYGPKFQTFLYFLVSKIPFRKIFSTVATEKFIDSVNLTSFGKFRTVRLQKLPFKCAYLQSKGFMKLFCCW